ncbi:MAG: hypothetical protein J6333_09825, partial [Planctomycetes bacterium]|nr:hypothetical protein [Planctomycetota bacterium]
MMRKVYWSLGLSLMMLCGSPAMAEDAAPGAEERNKKLENLLEIAVDRFQLNRYVEARAALNRLLAENPTDEEAFKLRKLFGEKILLEMQRFGNRPTLNEAERKALQMLGEAAYAMDRAKPDKAADRLEEVVKIFQDAKYAEDSFALKYAQELATAVKGLSPESTEEIHEYSNKIHLWREQLQSVGNVPLVLLSRAQRFEQEKLRSPETVRRIVNAALAGKDSAQRNLLEIIRLGVFAVPDLLDGLRDDKNDTRHTNAHFVLLTLGNRIVLPLCEALKSNDQLFLQQLCAVIGEIRPVDTRAIPYLKAVYDNPANLASTIDAAGYALRNITGKDPKTLLPAADYFLQEGNRYYFGGDDVDREIDDAKGTFWVWDQDVNDGKGALRELPVPSFAIADLLAEEMAYRGMATATDKTPFQILLGSVFMQQKNKIDTLNKLLAREDLSHPDTTKLRKDARDCGNRMERNQRISYTLGLDHMTAVLEKAMLDGKTEVAVNALDAIAVIAGENGWKDLQNYAPPAVAPAAKAPAPAAPAPVAPAPVAQSGAGASGDEG